MKQKVLTYILLYIIFGLVVYIYIDYSNKPCQLPHSEVRLIQPEFLTEELNDSILMLACEHYGIQEPKIVTAQAILETGWFRSKVFLEYNNPFGLYDSLNNDYYKFNHWTQALIAYINKVEYKRFEDEDYFDFLNRIGYAEDKEYISKLKQIISKLPP